MNASPVVKWTLTFVFLLLLAVSGRAQTESPDDQYLKIFNVVEQADALNKSGKTVEAKTKYQEAHSALINFRKRNPAWNAKVITYRLDYVTQQIAALSQTAAAPTNITAQEKPPTQSANQKVKLLNSGAEPRTPMRIKAKAGDAQTVDMITSVAMDMGASQTMRMPPIQATMEITVKNVSANGDISFQTVMKDVVVLEDPDVSSQIIQATEASLKGIQGISTTGTMSNRGFILSTTVKLPPGADAAISSKMEEMKDSFATAAATFPEEPIGTGAKWEVKLPLESQGMTINQTTTFELISIKGDQLHVKSSIAQSATNQKIQSPSAPTMKVDVTKFTGSGSGDSTFDLTKLLPMMAAMEAHSELSMTINQGGKKQEITTKTDMNLHLETK